MKYMKTLASMAAIAMLAACSSQQENNSRITIQLSEDENDMMVYMSDYDTGEAIDSVLVADGVAVFEGYVDKPALVRISVDGQRAGSLIREAGDIRLVPGENISGGALNKRFNDVDSTLTALMDSYRQLERDSTFEARSAELKSRVDNFIEQTIRENADNPIGYYYFIQQAYGMDEAELKDALKTYPHFAESKRVQTLLEGFVLKAETSEGKKFKDFEVSYNGETKRLSDFVGKGKYVLVDFWASWCGPCIRETAVIKDLLKEYGPKGLEVLGVAVWDEPENTLEAIEKHQLPWPQIINAQTIPTDLYGIMAIPSIILIDPEGTIVSRDKQDEELRAAVAAAFAE